MVLIWLWIWKCQVQEQLYVIIWVIHSCSSQLLLQIWLLLHLPKRFSFFNMAMNFVKFDFFELISFFDKMWLVQDKNEVQHHISILLCIGLACGCLMFLFTKVFGTWILTGNKDWSRFGLLLILLLISWVLDRLWCSIIYAFSAFTGPKNAHLVPAANTYVQVQFLFKSFMCSINNFRIFSYSFCADFLALLPLIIKPKLLKAKEINKSLKKKKLT